VTEGCRKPAPFGDWFSAHSSSGSDSKRIREEHAEVDLTINAIQGRNQRHITINYFRLTNYCCEQVSGISDMARHARGRRRGRRGQFPRKDKALSVSEPCKGRKPI